MKTNVYTPPSTVNPSQDTLKRAHRTFGVHPSRCWFGVHPLGCQRLALLLGTACLLLGTLPTALANITVANLDDSGPGSLRQAIAEAAPGDTIDFAVTGTITLTSGELVITNDLIISGPGATNLTLSGNSLSRVLQVAQGVVGVSGLTIANGRLPTAFAPVWSDYMGAGIWNGQSGTLTVSNCFVSGNTNAAPHPNYGGGICNLGTLKLINSEVSRNQAQYGGASLNGGALMGTNAVVFGTGFEWVVAAGWAG